MGKKDILCNFWPCGLAHTLVCELIVPIRWVREGNVNVFEGISVNVVPKKKKGVAFFTTQLHDKESSSCDLPQVIDSLGPISISLPSGCIIQHNLYVSTNNWKCAEPNTNMYMFWYSFKTFLAMDVVRFTFRRLLIFLYLCFHPISFTNSPL